MRSLVFWLLLGLLAYSHVIKGKGTQDSAANNWQLSEQGVVLETIDGQETFRIGLGDIRDNTKLLQDGIIEFDMYHSGERAFFYVYFRQQSTQDSEVVYLRTHKSNAPDTIQYAPVYQGRSAWQLYHGNNGTASANLSSETWVHVKLQIQGQFLSIWVGDSPNPVMKDMLLSRDAVAGTVSFRGNIPRQSGASYTAYLRNIKIRSMSPKTIEIAPTRYTENQLTQFKISQVFAAKKTAILSIPEAIAAKTWTTIPVQPNGMLEFLRWRTIPNEMRTWAVAADIQLLTEHPQTCLLNVGFSDTLTLLLNGQALLFADASYRYSEDRQEGLMQDQQLSVFLPLKKGSNQLRAIVADSFGGWGLTAALSECAGVTQTSPEKQ